MKIQEAFEAYKWEEFCSQVQRQVILGQERYPMCDKPLNYIIYINMLGIIYYIFVLLLIRYLSIFPCFM